MRTMIVYSAPIGTKGTGGKLRRRGALYLQQFSFFVGLSGPTLATLNRPSGSERLSSGHRSQGDGPLQFWLKLYSLRQGGLWIGEL